MKAYFYNENEQLIAEEIPCVGLGRLDYGPDMFLMAYFPEYSSLDRLSFSKTMTWVKLKKPTKEELEWVRSCYFFDDSDLAKEIEDLEDDVWYIESCQLLGNSTLLKLHAPRLPYDRYCPEIKTKQ